MSDAPLGRHPNVAAVFAIGLGILLLSLVAYRLAGATVRPVATVAFLLGLFGFGIVVVSGVWYVTLFVRDLL